MAKRHRISKGKSRSLFSHTAGNQHVHPRNMLPAVPMRGGIRL